MTDKILVAYASQAGSTKSVAEAIGQTLVECGAAVDVLPMKDVKDLTPYRAVVAGSAIHGGKWLPEAMQFMRSRRAGLNQKPFAAFLVCITMGMSNAEQYRPGLAKWLEPVRAQVRPISEGYFAGALDFNKIPPSFNILLLRLAVAFGTLPKGDHRDFNAVRAWASELAGKLQ
jgi:menaquinone-dependent protoporphyrinogen oxidase